MKNIDILLLVLSALWFCGSAFSVGLIISRRNKKKPATWLIFIWGVIFSWVFVGWVIGEMMALVIKSLGMIEKSSACQAKNE